MSYGTPSPAGYGAPPYNQMPQYMMGGAGGGPPPSGPPYGSMPSYNQHGPHAGGQQVPGAVSSYGHTEQHGYVGKSGSSYAGQQIHGAGGNFPAGPGNTPMGQSGFPHHGFYNSHSPRGSGPGSPYQSYGNTNIRHPSPPAAGGGNIRSPDMKHTTSGIYGYHPQGGGPPSTAYGYNGFGGGGNMPSPHQEGTTGCNSLRPNSPLSPHQNTSMYMTSHMVSPHQQKPADVMNPQSEQQNPPFSPHQQQHPHSGDRSGYSDNNQSATGELPSDNIIRQGSNNFNSAVAHNAGDKTSQSNDDNNIGNNSPVKNEQNEVTGEFSLIKHENSTDSNIRDNDTRSNDNSCRGGSNNSEAILSDKLRNNDNENVCSTSVKNEHLMDNLDSIPDLPEIPELKFSDMQDVGKQEPHEESVRSQGSNNHPHQNVDRSSNDYDNQQQQQQQFQSHKSSITPPLGSDQSTSGSRHQPLIPPKSDYDDHSSSHAIGGGGYGNCEMNRGGGDSGNASMPPLVAMEGMQANQEAEFMSMNISTQHQQSMAGHEEGGGKLMGFLVFCFQNKLAVIFIPLFWLHLISTIQIQIQK